MPLRESDFFTAGNVAQLYLKRQASGCVSTQNINTNLIQQVQTSALDVMSSKGGYVCPAQPLSQAFTGIKTSERGTQAPESPATWATAVWSEKRRKSLITRKCLDLSLKKKTERKKERKGHGLCGGGCWGSSLPIFGARKFCDVVRGNNTIKNRDVCF